MDGSAAFRRQRVRHGSSTLLRSLAGAVLCGAALTGCSSGGSGGSGDGSAALRAGPLMFIRAQLRIYGQPIEWFDSNGDGYIDYLARRLDGDGSFLNPAAFVIPGSPTEIFGAPEKLSASNPWGSADFNSDGLPDIVTAIEGIGDWEVAIHEQDATGSFGPARPTGIFTSFEVWVCELDGLPSPDLLVSRSGPVDSVTAYGGNGDGSFTPLGESDAILGVTDWIEAIVDVNGDGLDDQVGRDSADNPLFPFYVKLATGDGTFGETISIPPHGPNFVVPIDVNDDGFLDLLTTNHGEDALADRLTIHLGDSEATYATVVEQVFPSGFGADFVRMTTDVNGDEIADVIVSGRDMSARGMDAETDHVLFGNGDATFAAPALLPVRVTLQALDLDHDGHVDIIGNDAGPLHQMKFGNGDGTYLEETPRVLTAAADPRILFTDAPDIDGDGHLDVYARNRGSGDATVLYGDGAGQFTPGSTPEAQYHLSRPIDLDDDGDLDYLALDTATGMLRIDRTYGRDDVRELPPIPIVPPGDWRLDYVDVDGDGEEDLLLEDGVATYASFGLGDVRFEPVAPVGLRQFGFGFGVGETPQFADVNGDGRPDSVRAEDGELIVQLSNSMRGFDAPVSSPVGAGRLVFPPAWSDLNGDGKTDAVVMLLVAVQSREWLLQVYYGGADGTLRINQSLQIEGEIVEGRVCDIDADNDTDVVVFIYTVSVSLFGGQPQFAVIFENTGSGALHERHRFEAHFDPFAEFHLVDISGDGLVDIIAMSSATGLSAALNTGDGTFRGPYHFAVPSSTAANSPTFGDFDEDGDTDIAAAAATKDAVIYLENRKVQ